ncbi:protein kinase domain-containing protein [Planctomycetaceae bacterium SH139]
MSKKFPNESSVFESAKNICDESERESYLRRVCGNDGAFLAHIRALLAADGDQVDLLDQTCAAFLTPTDARDPIKASPGTKIDSYKLLQQIGEGGMGVVFMAEQFKPVERRVALKIIRPGMDSRSVIARFEAERQALAMMDHPNIARVLDAGTSQWGQPYFVMELVRGVPITQYCDEHRLSPRERLKLFVPVCQAIQHAHQKGIIHRDIKPSNVLVAEYDDHAVPKVIDFGVAKATQSRLTEKTLFTAFGQIVGTLDYMSPEQTKLNQLDIDTRSDIYSLGVLLYELLTGCTPFDRQRLRNVALGEVMRIIQEEEPPRPSLRASSSQTLPAIATSRHVQPHELTRELNGDLDWVVMKALEKDRTRRYETSNGFAKDIDRYLKDEAVAARPPSRTYLLRKLVRRHKGPVTAACMILAALTIGGIVATYQAVVISNTLKSEQATLAELGISQQETQQALTESREANAQKQHLLDSQSLILAFDAFNSGDLERSTQLLDRLHPQLGSAMEIPWRFLKKRIEELQPKQIDLGLDVTDWQITADGTVAFAGLDNGVLVTQSVADGRRRVHPLQSVGEKSDSIRGVLLSGDERHLLVAHGIQDGPHVIEAFERDPSDPLTLTGTGIVVRHPNPVRSMQAIGDSGRIVSSDKGGNLLIWDLTTGAVSKNVEMQVGEPTVACSSDGNVIAVAGYDDSNQVQFLTTNGAPSEIQTIDLKNRVSGIDFHPTDSSSFVVVGYFGVEQWRIVDQEARFLRRPSWQRKGFVAYNVTGDKFAVWAADSATTRVFDTESGDEICSFYESKFFPGTPKRIALIGKNVLRSSKHGLRQWSLPRHGLDSVKTNTGWYSDFGFGKSCGLISFRSDEEDVCVWDPQQETQTMLHVPNGETRKSGYAISKNGDRVAAVYQPTDDSTCRIAVWELPSERLLATLLGNNDKSTLSSLAFSPTNDNLLISSDGRSGVSMHDIQGLQTREIIGSIEAGSRLSCEFSASGDYLLIGANIWSGKRELRRNAMLYRVRGFDTELVAEIPTEYNYRATINNAETMIAIIEIDSTEVRLWDMRTKTFLDPLPFAGTRLMSIAFSPNDECLVGTTPSGELKFLDYHKREELGTFRVNRPLRHVRMQNGFPRIVASSMDGHIMQWEY